jgi:periplasmic protein TonB
MPVGPVPELPNEVSREVSADAAGFLRSCLVEGDSAQEARVRRSKRRALLVSIAVQIVVVAALVLFPLFSKGENIASKAFTPTVPYNPGRAPEHPHTTPQQPHGRPDPCRFCRPNRISPIIVEHDHTRIGDTEGPTTDPIPGAPDGKFIPGLLPTGEGPRRPDSVTPHEKERLQISGGVQQAMLIRRIEPTYPPLAIQIRHEGTVRLHAIISTDGSIQSLEVLSGDPLLIQSALAAVRQWRYRPTILNGQPVEVDTEITVIYSLNH